MTVCSPSTIEIVETLVSGGFELTYALTISRLTGEADLKDWSAVRLTGNVETKAHGKCSKATDRAF